MRYSQNRLKYPVELGSNKMFMGKSSFGAESLNAKEEQTKPVAHWVGTCSFLSFSVCKRRRGVSWLFVRKKLQRERKGAGRGLLGLSCEQMRNQNNSCNDEMLLNGLRRTWNAAECTIWPFNLWVKEEPNANVHLPFCAKGGSGWKTAETRLAPSPHEYGTESCWKARGKYIFFFCHLFRTTIMQLSTLR